MSDEPVYLLHARSGDKTQSEHAMRLLGVAALLVLAGHLRAYVFQNHGEASPTGVLLSTFYFASELVADL